MVKDKGKPSKEKKRIYKDIGLKGGGGGQFENLIF